MYHVHREIFMLRYRTIFLLLIRCGAIIVPRTSESESERGSIMHTWPYIFFWKVVWFGAAISTVVWGGLRLCSSTMSFNTTSFPFHHDLYPGVDFSSFNWFEKQWAAWYIAIGDPIIATGLMSFIMHEVGLFPSRLHSKINIFFFFVC
jgi:hypothetical protein